MSASVLVQSPRESPGATRTEPDPSGGSFAARGAIWPLTVAGVFAAPTIFIALNNPHVPGALGLCPLYAATGMYCPGCGGTRAVYDLAHGDVLGAMSMNPLLTLVIPLLVVLWVRWFLRGQGRVFKPWPFPVALGWIIPAVIVAFTVLRNTPMFAPYLAP